MAPAEGCPMTFRGSRRWILVTIALSVLALSLTTGCRRSAALPSGGSPATESLQPVGRSALEPAVTFDEPPADDLGGGQLIEETWDTLSMQGVRVGYSRTTTARVVAGD